MINFFKNAFNFIVGLIKREPDLQSFLASKSQDYKDLEAAVVDAIVAAKGGPINLFELYDGFAAAKRLFADRQQFVSAFSHFIKG